MNLHMSFQATTHFKQLDCEEEAQVDTHLADPGADLHVDVFMWYLVLIEMIRNVTEELLRILQLMKERLGDKHVLKKSL